MAHASKPHLERRLCPDCDQYYWAFNIDVNANCCIACAIARDLRRASKPEIDAGSSSTPATSSRIRQADRRD